MKVLVSVGDYSDKSFIHPRNKYYTEHGVFVTVLDFSCKEDYVVDGIKVQCLKSYKMHSESYDVLICHAANIRNHYFFLKKYGHRFKRFIFFFHGHEVLKCNKVYSKPYDFCKKTKISYFIQDVYDNFKLRCWKKYYEKVAHKSHFVFVSQWMLTEFLNWTKISFNTIKDRCSITYNCVSKEFEASDFDYKSKKQYDFVTIRGNLDGSKYCVDLVNSIAKNNPNKSFLLIGKGSIFNHISKSDNITWLNQTMTHAEIVNILQKARRGLMPTRTDSQGVMMCEMATLGMPVITSDLDVCHESLGSFDNVSFIRPEDSSVDLEPILAELESRLPYRKNDKYFNHNTSKKELDIINNITNRY